MKYLFTYENSNFENLEIENPTIEIVGLNVGNPNISKIDFKTKKYSIEILLIIPDAKFGLTLENVQSESLDWTGGDNLPQQVLDALNKQFGVLND
jgi:hypothetical protein